MVLNGKITVGLFGTCENTNWREEFIKLLNDDIETFNPVVNNWNEEAKRNEEYHKKNDDYILFVITPNIAGVYSIAEAVDMSNKRPDRVLFLYTKVDYNIDKGVTKFTDKQINSLEEVKKLIKNNGSKVFDSLEEASQFINTKKK